MKRRLHTLLLLVFTVATAAVVVLWVRSYFVQDILLFPFARHACGVYSASGQLLLRFGGFPYALSRAHGIQLLRDPVTRLDDTGPAAALVEFRYIRYEQPPPGGSVIVPHWFVAALAAGPPTIVALRRRRRRVGHRRAFPLEAAADAGELSAAANDLN
jgi:hypothetical protein